MSYKSPPEKSHRTLQNKIIDGGVASDQNAIYLPANTTANLAENERKVASIAYDTDLGAMVIDHGSGFEPVSNPGDITAVNAGTGLDGGGTSGSVTLDLADTAVTPGSYTNADITVDAQGRITAAANGAGGGATTALDNLASTAINANLVPATPNSVALGNGTNYFSNCNVGNIDGYGGNFYIESNDIDLRFYSVNDNYEFRGSYGGNGAEVKIHNEDDSGYVGLRSPSGAFASHAMVLPAADGAADDSLITDGAGNLSFASRANATLSNLGVTAINADLVPSADGTRRLGSPTLEYTFTHTKEVGTNLDAFYITAGAGEIGLYASSETVGLYSFNGVVAPELQFQNAAGSQSVNLKAPDALASTQTYTLPETDGNPGDVLSTDGSGVLSFAPAAGWAKYSYNYTDFQDPGITKDILIPLAAKAYVEAIIISIPTNAFAKSGGGVINLTLSRSTGGEFYPETSFEGTVDEIFEMINGFDGQTVAAGGRGYTSYGVRLNFATSDLVLTISVPAGVLDDLNAGDMDLYVKTSILP